MAKMIFYSAIVQLADGLHTVSGLSQDLATARKHVKQAFDYRAASFPDEDPPIVHQVISHSPDEAKKLAAAITAKYPDRMPPAEQYEGFPNLLLHNPVEPSHQSPQVSRDELKKIVASASAPTIKTTGNETVVEAPPTRIDSSDAAPEPAPAA